METAVCLSEEEDEVPPMPHDLRKPLPPPPPMPLPLPVQAAQPTQEPTKPSETEAQKQEPEKRDASPSPSPAAKASAAEEPAEEPVRKSPEPEPVRQKSPSQDSSQESEEEEEKPVRQDMEITRTPTPPRHVLQAAQQACQTYRSPVQLQGPDEPTSPADCIRVELDEESEPTERPPKEEDQAPETEPPAAAPAAEQPLKRPREPSEDLDFEAAPAFAFGTIRSRHSHRSTGPAHAAALGEGAAWRNCALCSDVRSRMLCRQLRSSPGLAAGGNDGCVRDCAVPGWIRWPSPCKSKPRQGRQVKHRWHATVTKLSRCRRKDVGGDASTRMRI